MRKISTVLTIGVSALALSVSAKAQDSEGIKAEEEVLPQDAIIITADRREQNLQDYAGTAATFSGEDLRARGIQDITDFNDELPGLTVANNGGNVEIWIRGVGSSNNTELGDPGAAFHYDGVYVPRPSGIGSAFFDIERVEVNVGPQGTLRGRNALAGSVNAIAWKPGIGVWDAELEVGYGNYDHKEFRGMLNVPIGDTVAFRVSGMYLGHDSYYNNVGPVQNVDVAEAEDNKAIRAQLLWEPNSRLSILVAGDYIHEEGTGYTGTNYAGPLGNGLLPEEIEDPRDVIANAFTPILDTKHYGLRGTITYETDPFTVEFTTSYRDLLYSYDANTPLTPFYPGVLEDLSSRDNIFTDDPEDVIIDDIILQENLDNWSRFQFITDSESYYNELRIFNSDGPFIWSLGGMYFKEEQYAFLGSTGDRGLFFQGIEFNNPDVDAESWSIYGDATFEVTDRFRVTAGLRYTDDKKSRTGVAARYGMALGGGAFECCGGARYGTEGFQFAGQDRTIFDPDTNGDGTISTQEIFDFQLDGVSQFGLRDNLDDILRNGPQDFYAALNEEGGAILTTECVDTISFDFFFCDGFTNDPGWAGGAFPGNPGVFTYALPFEDQIWIQDGQIADNFVDWRLRLEYDISPDNMVYALVASGHKSGTFNDNLGTGGFLPTTDTENVILYEIGTKNEFDIGNNRARLNASAFYNDYKDQAFSSLVSVETIADFESSLGETVDVGDDVSLALVVGYTFNAADSEIYGINVEGGLELPANINWEFNALWLEAKINEALAIPDSRFQADVEEVGFRDISGKRLPRTPRWQLNTSMSQNIDIPSGSLDWVISAGYRSDTFQTIYNSQDYEQPNDPRLRLNDVVKGYWTFDLGAGYSHDDGRTRFEVYANNVTNKQKESAIIITQFDNTRFFTRPRTFGARLRVRL